MKDKELRNDVMFLKDRIGNIEEKVDLILNELYKEFKKADFVPEHYELIKKDKK